VIPSPVSVFRWIYNIIMAAVMVLALAIVGVLVYASAVTLYLAAVGGAVIILVFLVIKEYLDYRRSEKASQH
jgi:hypothetical protein